VNVVTFYHKNGAKFCYWSEYALFVRYVLASNPILDSLHCVAFTGQNMYRLISTVSSSQLYVKLFVEWVPEHVPCISVFIKTAIICICNSMVCCGIWD